ncbi:MAG: hypothetical protein R2771_08910 [Saprospiraceae bacterium]
MKKFIFSIERTKGLGRFVFLLSFVLMSLNLSLSAQCNLSTEDHVVISLNETDCEATLTQEMFLTDDALGCPSYSYFEFEVRSASGSTVLIPRTENAVLDASYLNGSYMVTLWAMNSSGVTLNSAMTTFSVVDKVDPTIGCYKENTELSGTIEAGDSYFRTNSATTPPTGNCQVTNHEVYYNVFRFTVKQSDYYTFTLDGSGAPSTTFFAALYKDGFNPNDPCNNLISDTYAGEPNPTNGGSFSFTELLDDPGAKYILVTTTVDDGDTGDYTWEFSSTSGNGLFVKDNDCEFNVRCNDDLSNIGVLDLTIVMVQQISYGQMKL